jgi:hypothetical protein
VDELIELIRQVKSDQRVSRRGIPVGYAGVYTTFLGHPQLVAELDFLLIHVHPYHEGLPVEEAAAYVLERWVDVKSKYPSKEVIIGETGWPTEGDTKDAAVPSEENQRAFLEDFVNVALRENVPYFWFEGFDEKWKRDLSGVEAAAHRGLFYSDRTTKPPIRDFFASPPPLADILRPAPCGAGPDQLRRIKGQVYGINRTEVSSYRVIIYAGTDKWYVQPFTDQPLTRIRRNLKWSSRSHLGQLYAAFLVPEGYVPPNTLPIWPPSPDPPLNDDVLAISVKEWR